MEQGKGTSDVNCTSGSSLPDPIFTWLHYYLDLEVPSCCFSPRKEGQDVHRLPIAFPLTNSECCTHFQGEWWVGVVVPCFFFDSLHQVEALLWSQESRGRWRLTCAVFTSANARGISPAAVEQVTFVFSTALLLWESRRKASAPTQLLCDFLALFLNTLLPFPHPCTLNRDLQKESFLPPWSYLKSYQTILVEPWNQNL